MKRLLFIMLFVSMLSSCGWLIGMDVKQQVKFRDNQSKLETFVISNGTLVKAYFDNLDTLTTTEIAQIAEYRRQQCDSIVKALR